MLLKHGGALGLGRVGCEDWLHLDALQGLQDGFGRATRSNQLHQLVGPKPSFGLWRSRLLTPLAQGLRNPLFDGVEELEGHSQCQTQSGRRFTARSEGRIGLGRPRNPAGQFVFSQAGKHLRQ